MEKIKCAAIRYRLKGETEDQYMIGMSHSFCIGAFAAMDIPVSKRDITAEEQGFMTTSDRFVDREEAYIIAKAANQLNCKIYCERLFSEYVNYCIE